MRWGATDEEVTAAYPGAGLVSHGQRAATMAVTIDAPPDQVWPWLVQMGGDRGGWYSWHRLDNGGRPSATGVRPEWQDLALGDYVKYWTRKGPVDAWEVAPEPNRFLGLRGLRDLRGRQLDPKQPRPSAYTEGLWAFLLNELPGDRTRLVISGYQTLRPRWWNASPTTGSTSPLSGRCRPACWPYLSGTSNERPRHEHKQSPPERPHSPDTVPATCPMTRLISGHRGQSRAVDQGAEQQTCWSGPERWRPESKIGRSAGRRQHPAERQRSRVLWREWRQR